MQGTEAAGGEFGGSCMYIRYMQGNGVRSVCQIGNLVRVTLVRVAARAVVLMVRDAEQQVPRGKTSGLREAKRRSAADAQLKCMERCETGLALQAGLACSTDLRCVGVLPWHSCAFLVVSSVASEDSC